MLHDEGVRTTHDLIRDLDPPIHRPGVHHEDIRLGGVQALFIETVHPSVLGKRGKSPDALALELDPQDIDDIRTGNPGLEIVRDLHAECTKLHGTKRARPHDRDLGSQLLEAPDQGSSDPAVQNIADDCNLQPLDPSQSFTNREHIQQRLGWVLVLAIACIDHRGIEVRRDKPGRTGRGVTHHDVVRTECGDRLDRIQQRLSLAEAARTDIEIDDIRAQTLGRHLEGHARPSRVLEKEVDDRPAPERVK